MARQDRGAPAKVKQQRSPLNLKTSPELRQRIEAAAESSGLSMTQEVERRLERSFDIEERLGGSRLTALYGMMTWAIQITEKRIGQRWDESFESFHAALGAVEAAMNTVRPPYPPLLDAELRRLDQLWNQAVADHEKTAAALAERFPFRRPPNALAPLMGSSDDQWSIVPNPKFDHLMEEAELAEALKGLSGDDAGLVIDHQEVLKRLKAVRVGRTTILEQINEAADRARAKALIEVETTDMHFRTNRSQYEAFAAKKD